MCYVLIQELYLSRMRSTSGKYLICLGFTLAGLSPYLILILGVPPFLLGAILLLGSNEKANTKILWLALPLLLWLPVMLIFLSFF